MPVSLLLLQSDAWSPILWRMMPGLGITMAFALIAYGLRAVTASGAIAGLIVTYSILLAAGPAGFLAVLTVFVLTTAATRFGYARRGVSGGVEGRRIEAQTGETHIPEAIGTDGQGGEDQDIGGGGEAHALEDKAVDAHGRNAAQVYANLLAAALVAVPAIFHPRSADALFIAMCAVLAEAAADTVSSEIGQAVNAPTYLITTFRSTPIGDNGGISIAGTTAGMIAAFIVSLACAWMRLIDFRGFLVAVLAGIAGMFFDSYLGATLERPGRLGNNSVNFTSTVFAASVALIATLVLT